MTFRPYGQVNREFPQTREAPSASPPAAKIVTALCTAAEVAAVVVQPGRVVGADPEASGDRARFLMWRRSLWFADRLFAKEADRPFRRLRQPGPSRLVR
jgi:hypothetical protein